ncbi:MAG: 16S rRNA (guanine(527)-N(7))-methyltransferase RsmG [Gammaproteobacteria bacterium]|nr:16S rRNA (guanine(527)-N(7))-methyltransferase RsmG [Gammaproteobacteria bacterium]
MSPDPPGIASVTGLRPRLHAGACAFGLALSDTQLDALLRLLEELSAWNRAYNLTAVTAPESMLTHHLLDSLAASPDLAGPQVVDVGTGAGFPGLPLAIVHPDRHFTLLDAVAKKIRFVTHCVRALGLGNVTARHGRAEQLGGAARFDTVITRACAPLPGLLAIVAPLCGQSTRLVALQGHYPAEELAALPRGWRLESCRAVVVPGLAAERHILRLIHAPADAASATGAATR